MAQTTANLVSCLQVSSTTSSRLLSDANIDAKDQEPPDDHPEQGKKYAVSGDPVTDSTVSTPPPGITRSTDKSGGGKKRTWKDMHRVIEQMENEPVCIIVFKWLLIVVGAVMLGVVVVIMSDVIYDWFSGHLAEQYMNRTLLASTNTSTMGDGWDSVLCVLKENVQCDNFYL